MRVTVKIFFALLLAGLVLPARAAKTHATLLLAAIAAQLVVDGVVDAFALHRPLS